MKVSKAFLKDFAYLANLYHWNEKDVEELKQATRENTALADYWTELAAAHRAGYRQTKENGYIRLHVWKELQQ